MTKQQYATLRSTLDFRLAYGWIVGHILGDFVLTAGPAAAVLWLHRHPAALWIEIAAYTLAAASLAAFYFRSFSMMHEAVHGTISTNRRWNDLAGTIYGAFCLLPFDKWREIHLLHHLWAGNIEKDPVRKLVLVFRQPPNATRRFLSWVWRSWFPILALMQHYVFWYESVTRFWKKPTMASFVGLAVPFLVWGSLLACAGLYVSAALLVPSFLLFMALEEVVNFPHHMDLPQYEGETKLALWEQYKIARSCFYTGLLERFVLLNFNYHTEHHLYPTLPWYRLKQLSQRLRHELEGYNFSVGNEWIMRNRSRPLEVVCTSTSEEVEPVQVKAA